MYIDIYKTQNKMIKFLDLIYFIYKIDGNAEMEW